MTPTVRHRPLAVRDRFSAGRGYLAACTLGLPADVTVDAVRRDLERWAAGTADAMAYTAAVERSRDHAAALLGVERHRIATGSQVSPFVGLAAASAPAGAEIVCIEGDFSSLVAPFLARGDLRVRQVPLDALADEVRPGTWMVAYSLVQSATGRVTDAASVAEAARGVGARVLVDATQATGWMPTTDVEADLLVCHAYKWLCAPHGTGLLYVRREKIAGLWPLMAAPEALTGNIRKFEEIGTHPAANVLAVGEALTFHQGLGGARKQARLSI